MDESISDYYGAVISDNVFEHLFDLEDVIKKIYQSLKAGVFWLQGAPLEEVALILKK